MTDAKFKTWALIIAWLFAAPVSAATGSSLSSDLNAVSLPAEQGALLWKVQRSGLAPSYVYASVQAEDPAVTHLAPAVIRAFTRARSYSMALVPDHGVAARMGRAMFLRDGHNLRELLGEHWFDKTAKAMAPFSVSADTLSRLQPWVVFTALTMPSTDKSVFVDVFLYAAALQEGKAVHSLETADEQVSVFDDISVEDQVALLKAVVAHNEDVNRFNSHLVRSYTAGDYQAIAALSKEYLDFADARLSHLIRSQTIGQRNVRMVERMLPRIEEEAAFIVVDALRLPGRDGVLQLLKERGYRVSPVRY